MRFSLLALAVFVAAPALAQSNPSQERPVSPADSPRGAEQAVGQRFSVSLDDAPEPYYMEAVRNSPLGVPREGRRPRLPDGFSATLYAEGLEHPRQLLVLPNGDVLIAEQNTGYLTMTRDDDGDGRADWVERHAGGFNQPHGLAYRDGEILVTDQDGIWSIGYTEGSLRPPYPLTQPASEVPESERVPSPNMDAQKMISASGVFGLVAGHRNRDLEIGPSGRLFVGVGSVGNLGIEPEPKATIQSFNASGADQQTVATGLRNATGFAFHPQTGALWSLVQERDGMGDRLVPDYLARIEEGAFYGWPYAYLGPNPQPDFADDAPDGLVEQTVTPALLFESHSAAMDLAFYDAPASAASRFPAEYRDGAFVALHGSWNRAVPTGYKVVFVPFEGGEPTGEYVNFATGFWTEGDEKALVWGRPVDVVIDNDGALLIADDAGGTVWRVTYTAR